MNSVLNMLSDKYEEFCVHKSVESKEDVKW